MTVEVCPPGEGVTVIVEPTTLGGETQGVCAADGGGRSAADLFTSHGFELDRVSSSPDFVCRVDGLPADAGCAHIPPASGYWALWWSDGSSAWSYASLGVDGLSVPDGGSVAFTWTEQRDQAPLTPVPHLAGGPEEEATPSASASPSAGAVTAEPASRPAEEGEAGLPGWVAPGVLGLLVLVGALVVLLRRLRT